MEKNINENLMLCFMVFGWFVSYMSRFHICRKLYYLPVIISHRFYLRKLRKEAKQKNKTLVFFLHIGKTGGNAIKNALGIKREPLETEKYIVVPPRDHRFNLKETKPGEKVFFVLRDPLDRFVSGFYEKKKKKNSFLYHQTRALEFFKTPNQLAEALSSQNPTLKREAKNGMRYIQHVKNRYEEWIGSKKYLEKRSNDVLFVGRQENLDDDFERLKKILGLGSNYKLSKDPKVSNINKNKTDPYLSELSKKNLRPYLNKDYEVMCLLKENGLLK